ncbi:MAG: hypothetical protein ACXV2D_07465, partial [Halobacteriota archaeon]
DIDRKVVNASRVCKLYGTTAHKGVDNRERPHRLSKLLYVPKHIDVVGPSALKTIAVERQESQQREQADGVKLDVRQWLDEHRISVFREKDSGDGITYVLDRCPFNPSHTDHSAWVFQYYEGGIAAGCHHNGCAGNGWRELRRVYERDATEALKEDRATEAAPEPPKSELFEYEELAQWLVRHPKEMGALYLTTFDDYHEGDNKLKPLYWRSSYRISVRSVYSLFHHDTTGESRTGKTDFVVCFVQFLPSQIYELFHSVSKQVLWHKTHENPEYFAEKIFVILEAPENDVAEVFKAIGEEQELPLVREVVWDKGIRSFVVKGPRMLVICSVMGPRDTHKQIASRCWQTPIDAATEDHRRNVGLLNTANNLMAASIANDMRTKVLRRCREIIHTAAINARYIAPDEEAQFLMIALGQVLIAEGFNETNKKQGAETLALCAAVEKIFKRDPTGKTIQIRKEDVLEAWGLVNAFGEFVSANLNRNARDVLKQIPTEGDGKPQIEIVEDSYGLKTERAVNEEKLMTVEKIAARVNCSQNTVYNIVRATGDNDTVGPLFQNDLIKSTEYTFDGKRKPTRVFWRTKKGDKAVATRHRRITVNGKEYTPRDPYPANYRELVGAIPEHYRISQPHSNSCHNRTKDAKKLSMQIQSSGDALEFILSYNGSTQHDIQYAEVDTLPSACNPHCDNIKPANCIENADGGTDSRQGLDQLEQTLEYNGNNGSYPDDVPSQSDDERPSKKPSKAHERLQNLVCDAVSTIAQEYRGTYVRPDMIPSLVANHVERQDGSFTRDDIITCLQSQTPKEPVASLVAELTDDEVTGGRDRQRSHKENQVE